jgi:hypothetical protein
LRTALAAAREEAASLRVALRERAAQVEQLRAQVRERDAELEALRDQLLTVVPEPAALEPTALEPAAVPSPSSPRPPTVARPRPSRRRRTGSLLYVAGATGAVAVGAVLIANGDDSAVSKAAATPRVPTATPRSPSGPVTRARVATEFTMTPVGRSTVAGSGALLKAGRHLTLVIELKAPRRDRASLFAVWLTGSARPKLLGFVPPAQTAGTFSGDTPLPVNARRYRTVTVTFERSHAPARPGTRILRAALPPLRSSSGR